MTSQSDEARVDVLVGDDASDTVFELVEEHVDLMNGDLVDAGWAEDDDVVLVEIDVECGGGQEHSVGVRALSNDIYHPMPTPT